MASKIYPEMFDQKPADYSYYLTPPASMAKGTPMTTQDSTAVLEPTASAPVPAPTCYLCKTPLCDYCGLCEVDACQLLGKAVTTKAQMVELRHLLANTQKARGYVTIAEYLQVPKPFAVISELDEISTALTRVMAKIGTKSLFVRPCPVRPRHGFVESRTVVNNATAAATIERIMAEAKAADPDAELLIVPAIDAKYNLILTPSRMAIGEGNDGATAGRGSKIFPLAGIPFKELPAEVVKKAGVNTESEDPYVEVVIDEAANVFFTQLRAGVRLAPAVGADFIPNRTVVDKVVEASGDLLEWERQVLEEIKPGTAVYHLGGTLISHYGVHCIFSNIPILTSRKPVVGEELIPTARPTLPSPDAVIRGLALGASEQYIFITHQNEGKVKVPAGAVVVKSSAAVDLMLVCAHNAAAMGGDDGTWIGISAALMMRLGMAASHGEARHKAAQFQGSREWVYRLALNDFLGARDTIGFAQWRFKNLSWSSSYGGPKWALCTESVIRLEKDARTLITDPTDAAVAALVVSLHNAINQAHNGGWWMNKFVSTDVFDKAAQQSVISLSKAAPGIYDLSKSVQPDVTGLLRTWREAVDPVIQKGLTVGDGKTPINPDEKGQPADVSASDDDGDDDEDSTDSTGDGDNELCGDKDCPSCYPEQNAPAASGGGTAVTPLAEMSGNVNNYMLPSGTLVTAAQARISTNGEYHLQVRLSTIPEKAYKSYDHVGKIQKPAEIKKYYTAPSYSGSGSLYAPLTFEPVKDEPGYWKFTHEALGFTCTYYIGGV